MSDLFEFFGQAAIILMVISGISGIFGAQIRKFIKGPQVYNIHKWSGIGALLFGMLHGLIYSVFMD